MGGLESCDPSLFMHPTLSIQGVGSNTSRLRSDIAYTLGVPKLWTGTIEAHRQQVHSAVVASAANLVALHGLRGLTMSGIAEDAGIGRATLYKYFPNVESILTEWHDEQITQHLGQLSELASSTMSPEERLTAALNALAHISYAAGKHGPGPEIAAILHAGDHATRTDQDMRRLLLGLIKDAVGVGVVRADIPAEELTTYCVNAAMGSRRPSSPAALQRVTQLIMASLKP